MLQNTPLLIGHRGAAARLPENTIASFRMAFENFHADMAEFDIRFSKDRVPIVIHDATLDRTTEGRGYVYHWNYEDLKTLDAGFWFDPQKNKNFPQRGKGIEIPSFAELLKTFPDKNLCVEIKEKEIPLTDAVMALIKQHHFPERCIVGSKHDAVSRRMREKYPATARFWSSREIVMAYLDFKRGATPKEDPRSVASMPLERCGLDFSNAGFIQYLHAKRVRVFYWTIDDVGMIRTLAERKADGIITNDPALMPPR